MLDTPPPLRVECRQAPMNEAALRVTLQPFGGLLVRIYVYILYMYMYMYIYICSTPRRPYEWSAGRHP